MSGPVPSILTPALKAASGLSIGTTPSVSVAAGDLLLVFCEYKTSTGNPAATISDSSGMTWTNIGFGGGAASGRFYAWACKVPTARSITITVSTTQTLVASIAVFVKVPGASLSTVVQNAAITTSGTAVTIDLGSVASSDDTSVAFAGCTSASGAIAPTDDPTYWSLSSDAQIAPNSNRTVIDVIYDQGLDGPPPVHVQQTVTFTTATGATSPVFNGLLVLTTPSSVTVSAASGALTLSAASVVASGRAAAPASLDLIAAGAAAGGPVAPASLDLTGNVAALAQATSTAALTFDAFIPPGGAFSPGGSGSLTLSAGGTAVPRAAASGSLTLAANQPAATARPLATATLTLLAAGQAAQGTAAPASLTLTAGSVSVTVEASSTDANLWLVASGVASYDIRTAPAALTLTALTPARAVAVTSAQLTLAASATGIIPGFLSASAALTLTGSGGSPQAIVTALSGSLSLTGSVIASLPSGPSSAALTLSGTVAGTGRVSSASAALTLTASAFAGKYASGPATITLTATAAGKAQPTSTAALSLSATGIPRLSVSAATGALALTAAAAAIGRVSGFDPMDLPSKAIVLRVAALALNDGDAVTAWVDRSGNGWVFGQPTGTRQPVFRAAALGGRPCVEFDGVDDNLYAVLGTAALALPHRTVYLVGQFTATPVATSVVLGSGSEWYISVSGAPLKMHSSIRNVAGAQLARIATTALDLTVPNILTWLNDVAALGDPALAVTRKYWRSGANVLTSTADTTGEIAATASTWALGALSTTGANAVPIRISEVWIFAEAHDDATRQLVETYFADQYGIAYAQPSREPSATASLSLSAAAPAAAQASATGSLTLSGTGTASVPRTATGSLSLSAGSAGIARASATAAVTLTATVGQLSPPASGSAALTLTASTIGSAAVPAAAAALALLASSTVARASAAAHADLTLVAGPAAAVSRAAGSATVVLTATGLVARLVTATAALTLTGSTGAKAQAAGSGTLTLTATARPSLTIIGSGSVTLTASMAAKARVDAASAVLTVTATVSARASAAAGAAVSLSMTMGSAAQPRATAQLTLTGQPVAVTVSARATAVLTLTAAAAPTGRVLAGTAVLALTASAHVTARASATAAVALTAAGAVRGRGTAAGQLILVAAGGAAAKPPSAAGLSLTAAGSDLARVPLATALLVLQLAAAVRVQVAAAIGSLTLTAKPAKPLTHAAAQALLVLLGTAQALARYYDTLNESAPASDFLMAEVTRRRHPPGPALVKIRASARPADVRTRTQPGAGVTVRSSGAEPGTVEVRDA